MANLNKHSSYSFDLCATTDCQVYKGTSLATSNSDYAVNSTAGQYLTYNGGLCETYYMSCDGGATESSENVWGGVKPYLKGVVDPYEAKIDTVSGYYWTKTYTGDQLTSIMKGKGYSCSDIVNFYVSKTTPTGNVAEITLVDSNGKKITFANGKTRTAMGFKSQRYTISSSGGTNNETYYVNSASETIIGKLSEMFAIGSGGTQNIVGGTRYTISGSGAVTELQPAATSGSAVNNGSTVYTVSGSGHGHNVGMSQWGAYSMAKYYYKNYKDILQFYYNGTSVVSG